MKHRAVVIGIMVAALGMTGLAQANPGHGNPGNGHGNGHAKPGQAGHQNRGHDARDDHRDWHEGGHVPQRYRDDSHWVHDWHGHGLSEPPHGYRWLDIDGDYVLAAVATGVITAIILGR